MVRFVQLRRPLHDLLSHDGTTIGAVNAADELRDELLTPKANAVNDRFRIRLINQGELWSQGVHLRTMLGSKDKGEDSKQKTSATPEYFGGKWGVHLRAPDLWFELLDECGPKFVPLGDIAEVHFGIKTGKDSFFFPQDCSADCLEKHPIPMDFQSVYGIPQKEVKTGKVKLVRCGSGRREVRPIESEYLEPEVHSLMEIKGATVRPEDCSRLILLIGKKRASLKGQYVLDYIEWGEQLGYHAGSTCANRVTANREWYDLTGHIRGAMFWSMQHQYKHAVPLNEHNLICNHNLFDVSPKKVAPEVLAGILNSSWVLLSKYQFGRPVGVEGNFKTEVIDVKMMRVPDPTGAPQASLGAIVDAFRKMKGRIITQFLSERRLREMSFGRAGKQEKLAQLSEESEIDSADRHELDDAVLRMLGIRSASRRAELVSALYDYLRQFFEWMRQKEEKGIANKNTAKRAGRIRPAEIASQLYREIVESQGQLLRQYDPDFLDKTKAFDTFDLPPEGSPAKGNSLFHATGVVFRKGRKTTGTLETHSQAQDSLVILLAENGIRGLVRAPRDPQECEQLTKRFGTFLQNRGQRIRELIAERTSDEDLQSKIEEAVLVLIRGAR